MKTTTPSVASGNASPMDFTNKPRLFTNDQYNSYSDFSQIRYDFLYRPLSLYDSSTQDKPIFDTCKIDLATGSPDQKGPGDYERAKVKEYDYSTKTQTVEPRILSFIISDVKTNELVSITKEQFEELLLSNGVPCKCYCRCSFAKWLVVMSTEEEAKKLSEQNIVTEFFRLKPEYVDTQTILENLSTLHISDK